MTTRAVMHRSVLPASILKRLPPRFRPHVDVRLLGSELVDLIIFQGGELHVVTSKDLRKILGERAKRHGRLVAVGYDFTREARDRLGSLGGIVFSERQFPIEWTDASWHAIRQR